MAKIELDKYYTPIDVAKYCIDKTFEIIGKENITHIVEPSAGNGSFSTQLECDAYDIEPEHPSIKQQNYLKLNIQYQKGRLIIGNPPFGRGNSMSVKFFKKSIMIGDYIAFILPISQLNNNIQMYDFDLIYSENLGSNVYSGVVLNCCFNIYKRPESGLNQKPNFKLKDISIVGYRRGGNENIINKNYDYAMGTFGVGCVGKQVAEIGTYASECYFYIHNNELKNEILNVLKNTNWKDISKGISNTYNLPQWKIYKHLKENVDGVE